MPEGFLGYFTCRYPKLFMHVHGVVKDTGPHVPPSSLLAAPCYYFPLGLLFLLTLSIQSRPPALHHHLSKRNRFLVLSLYFFSLGFLCRLPTLYPLILPQTPPISSSPPHTTTFISHTRTHDQTNKLSIHHISLFQTTNKLVSCTHLISFSSFVLSFFACYLSSETLPTCCFGFSVTPF
ncbi:hypothetical protein BYT27DRAFT_6767011 [Phlegmacium glaucopus]|nr:hypothetical protein BYT27DRAFT_6767011 [Phlegmacium glaucopus]